MLNHVRVVGAGEVVTFNPLTHPDVIAEWDIYEADNTRAMLDYYQRHSFREVRRDKERHLFQVAAS